MPKPNLIFFCELDETGLLDLFTGGRVVSLLEQLDAGVSLGILDLSDTRAEIVRSLNKANIPVIGWLLLPKEQGYWFNSGNWPYAQQRYTAFKEWTAKHNLQWAGIGLDIEPDRNEMEQMIHSGWMGGLRLLRRGFTHNENQTRAQFAYEQLVTQMRNDGYHIDVYHIPTIVDERRAKADTFSRILGLVDVPADREVLMLYSSFFGELGVGALWSFAPQAQSIGVGSTGGGVDMGDLQQRTLSWDEFARDLILASYQTTTIHIFSLEGCVNQGFVEPLIDFDWTDEVAIPRDEATQVGRLRSLFRMGLWLSARPRMLLWSIVLFYLFLRRRSK